MKKAFYLIFLCSLLYVGFKAQTALADRVYSNVNVDSCPTPFNVNNSACYYGGHNYHAVQDNLNISGHGKVNDVTIRMGKDPGYFATQDTTFIHLFIRGSNGSWYQSTNYVTNSNLLSNDYLPITFHFAASSTVDLDTMNMTGVGFPAGYQDNYTAGVTGWTVHEFDAETLNWYLLVNTDYTQPYQVYFAPNNFSDGMVTNDFSQWSLCYHILDPTLSTSTAYYALEVFYDTATSTIQNNIDSTITDNGFYKFSGTFTNKCTTFGKTATSSPGKLFAYADLITLIHSSTTTYTSLVATSNLISIIISTGTLVNIPNIFPGYDTTKYQLPQYSIFAEKLGNVFPFSTYFLIKDVFNRTDYVYESSITPLTLKVKIGNSTTTVTVFSLDTITKFVSLDQIHTLRTIIRYCLWLVFLFYMFGRIKSYWHNAPSGE